MGEEGELIAGRYRPVSLIGRGAMGIVWRAHDERLDRAVAVKQLLLDVGLSDAAVEEAVQRTMREGRIAARVQHPNAVAVHDVVEHGNRPWLVMEYLPSQSLSAVAGARGGLPADEVAAIGAQVAAALDAVHAAGIVHRDIKPDNVLIAGDGTVKLTDFGISRSVGDGTVSGRGVIAGTPAFLAPEVAGGGRAGFPSDVFSLGSTLYAAIEGDPPFGTDENTIALLMRVAAGQVTPPKRAGALTPVLMALLDPDPAARPTARQAQEALTTGKPPAGRPPTPTLALPAPPHPLPSPPSPPRRRRLVAGIVAVVLVAVGVLIGLALRGDGGSPQAGQGSPQSTSSRAPTTSRPAAATGCAARFEITNSWPDGYQALVTVRNDKDLPLKGWTVTWTLPSGHRIDNLWNGILRVDGSAVSVASANWNTTLRANESTTFGFIADTTTSNPARPTVQCTSP